MATRPASIGWDRTKTTSRRTWPGRGGCRVWCGPRISKDQNCTWQNYTWYVWSTRTTKRRNTIVGVQGRLCAEKWVGRLGTGEPRKDDGKPLQRDAVEAGHKGTVHDFSLCLVPCEHNAYEYEVVRLLQQQWVEVRERGGWRCCYLPVMPRRGCGQMRRT